MGRYYERMGDHAVNISERVQYMVTGWLPEHTGAARLQARGVTTAAASSPAPTGRPAEESSPGPTPAVAAEPTLGLVPPLDQGAG